MCFEGIKNSSNTVILCSSDSEAEAFAKRNRKYVISYVNHSRKAIDADNWIEIET